MAVAIRSSTKNYVASAQSIAINTPSGAVAGDMLVAFVYADGNAAAYNWSAATPADWTLMDEQGPTGGTYFASFRRLLPSGTPPASYTFNVAGATNLPLHGVLVALNPDGGGFDTPSTSKNGGASITVLATNAVTGVAGDSVLLCAFGANSNRAISSAPASMAELQFSNQTTSDVYVYGQLTPGSGSITKSATWDGLTSIGALAVLFPMVTGPTITVQPVADTVILTNESTATFSVTATGTGSLTYDWELETSVGGGVYANLADGNGATWTGQTAASCTATLTAKTLSGRRVRCNVTDDNGTTTSTAVALTIYDGPTLTTFGPTNGSGVSTATLTCDYVTGVGEAIEVAIVLPDGRLSVSTTTT